MTAISPEVSLGPVTLAFDHVKAMRACVQADLSAADLGAIKRALAGAVDIAVLTDPEHDLAGVRRCLRAGQALVVSIEDGDYATPQAAPRMLPGWDVARAVGAGADVIKCFFWYEPGPAGAPTRAFLTEVADQCSTVGVPLLAEPILALKPGEDHVDQLLETVRQLSGFGIAALKLEFPGGAAALPNRAADACAEITRLSRVPWFLLSKGVSFELFSAQLATAVGGGAAGCVVGRAAWGDLVSARGLSADAKRDLCRRLDQLAAIASNQPRNPLIQKVEP